MTDVAWKFFCDTLFMYTDSLNVDKVLNLINPHVTIVVEERNGGK